MQHNAHCSFFYLQRFNNCENSGSTMRIIRAKAPVRLDLAGGWTDVPPFTHDSGGEVVNIAINKYAHCEFKVDDSGRLSANYHTEVPIGSGLGTSSAMNVALLSCIKAGSISGNEVAHLAHDFENLIGNRVGRQDQWASANGGVQHLLFIGDDVEILPFEPLPSALRWLRKHLVVAYCGKSHVSGDIHSPIWEKYAQGDEVIVGALLEIRKLASNMAIGLQQDRRDIIIQSLKEVTAAVDKLDLNLNAPFRSVCDDLMSTRTALAWKVMGAGGGGCVGIISNLEKRDEVENTCESAGWELIDWDYDEDGVVVTQE